MSGIGPKDIDLTPVFPRYYSPGLPEEEGFQFKSPEFLWYFIAKKLYREISSNNSTPLEYKEFINEIHQFLCRMLAKDKNAINILEKWLVLPENLPIVRNFAAFELGMTGTKTSIRHLIQQLKSDSGQNVRSYAAMALGMIKDRKVVPELLQIFYNTRDDQVKRHLREAILYIKNVIPCPYW